MSKHNGDHREANRHAADDGASSGKRRVALEMLTALALGQLSDNERAAIERELTESDESAARQAIAETERLASELASTWKADSSQLAPATELREAVLKHLAEQNPVEVATMKRLEEVSGQRRRRNRWTRWVVAGGLACLALGLGGSYWWQQLNRVSADRAVNSVAWSQAVEQGRAVRSDRDEVESSLKSDPAAETMIARKELARHVADSLVTESSNHSPAMKAPAETAAPTAAAAGSSITQLQGLTETSPATSSGPIADLDGRESHVVQPPTIPIPDATTTQVSNATLGLSANVDRLTQLERQQSQESKRGESISAAELQKHRLYFEQERPQLAEQVRTRFGLNDAQAEDFYRAVLSRQNGEAYSPIVENPFLSPLAEPHSTFSIDVDTASYANVRRFLNEGRLPPADAVRIEELVNYFQYSYPQPDGREPFSVNMEAAECPWNAGHLLLRVGLKGKEIDRGKRPASNLVFLVDVSGSMSDENKLPLVKTALRMLVGELTEDDRVSIVTYAGEGGLRLPPTRGHDKDAILAAIDSLSAGGSTHGSAGIQLAYEQTAAYFVKEGTNRVILATDGDLNVGVTSDDALVELIKMKAAGGTFLTVLGFGTGNLKDGKLEKLADSGNGVYAYVDSVREARKVLVEELSGSLVTIAKDVKIQIEFNPAQIASYRLLGYENRILAAADFHDDKKDAGEIGAGHTVTALYELVPVGVEAAAERAPSGQPLKYQAAGDEGRGTGDGGPKSGSRLTDAAASGELLTLKLRYKEPEGVESRLVEFPLKARGGRFGSASPDQQFAAAVARFGMLLRGSEHAGTGNMAAVAEIAASTLGNDPGGYRAEFVDLVRKAQSLGAK
jgi:Ca-activated chloride channel family protein